MQTLSPNKLADDAWRRWLKLAWQLVRQRLAVHLLAGSLCLTLLVVLAVGLELKWAFVCSWVSAPILVLVFQLRALGSDTSHIIAHRSPTEWIRLLLRVLGSGLVASFILISLATLLIVVSISWNWAPTPGDAAAVEEFSKPSLNPYVLLASLGLLVFPLMAYFAQNLLPGLSIWFVVPIMLYFRVGLWQAYRLSLQAEQQNWSSVNACTILVLLGLMLTLFTGGLFSIVFLPLLGFLQIISFREVYLGQLKQPQQVGQRNQPVRRELSKSVTSNNISS